MTATRIELTRTCDEAQALKKLVRAYALLIEVGRRRQAEQRAADQGESGDPTRPAADGQLEVDTPAIEGQPIVERQNAVQ